ncbi:MAG: hypothetical protein ABIW82_00525, partial [Dokdonella sp.]
MRDWSARSDSNNNQRTRSWSALWRRLAGAIVPVAASAMVIGACAVHAEGSRSLFPAGYPAAGFRAAMDVRTGNTYASVVAGNQFLYVYAKAGEFILVGSSNRANGGDIFVYNPQSFGTPGVETIPGTAAYTCSAAAPVGSFGGGTRGQLTSRNNELAGPNSANNTVTVTNGFSPCAYLAPSDGVYGVRFTGATAGGSNTPDGIVATPQVLTSQIAAWDVVVRANATSTADINGRLFTYAWIGFTGNNPRPVYHTLYYVSTDGYRYRQDMRGIDPNAYALWANRAAFVDNGSPLYKDIRGSSQYVPTPLPAGTGINPQNAQYPIFFSDIGSAGPNATEATRVLQVLGIPDVPAVPTLTSGSFVGNVSGSTSTVGAGGTFQFDTTNTLSYQIVISRNGIDFDPATTTNRVLTGVALTGTHYVLWDGLDNAGAAFPSGTTYSYRMTGRNGEIHFPMIDAESNATGGPTLTKLNGSLDSKVFYDDRGYKTSNGTAVGVLNGLLCGAGNLQVPPVLDHSLLGVDSSVLTAGKYYRYWSGTVNSNADCVSTAANDFGDGKGLDLWAFQLTADIIGTVTIVPVSTSVDVGTSVAVDATAFPGNIVYGSFVFGNYGSANATGVTYAATIGTAGNCPASVTFTLVPAGVTAVYNAGTCAITFTGLPATLGGGQTRGFNFNYPAPNPGTVPVHTTITATNESVGATAPNSANGLTTIVISDLTISKAHVGNFRQGQIGATYTLTATNSGTGATAGTVTVTDTLPIGLTATAISGSGWACTLSPLACTRADSLAAGASYPVITVTVDVAANAAASLTNTATVAGGSEANTGNDSATDPTTVTASQLTVTKTASPTPFLVGQAASYSIVVQNTGNATTIGNITVTDNLPAGITLGSASGTNWSCTGTTALSCTFTGTLAASASTTLTLNVVVGVGAANGNNSATASGGGDSTCPLASHCSDTVTVAVVSAADLAIIKTGPANATAGQNVSYTLAVTNNGPSPATSVSLADPTPAGLGFVSASAPCAGGFPCALGTLANGASVNVTVTFSVPAGATGSITNTATVTSPTLDPTPGDNSSTVVTPIVFSADIEAVKTGPASVGFGGALSFTVVVTNHGPSSANGTTFNDAVPAAITGVTASCG